jgi:hypothetical protein
MTTSPPAWLPVKDEAKDPFKENAARLFGLRRTVTKRAPGRHPRNNLVRPSCRRSA